MADMAVGDITYTTAAAGPFVRVPGRVTRSMVLTFPNNAANLTYPTGGIPLNKAALGCPRVLAALKVNGKTPVAGDANPVWMWNGSNTSPTLVGYETATAVDSPLKQLTAAQALTLNSEVLTVEVEGY
jgi:hypothetical protein